MRRFLGTLAVAGCLTTPLAGQATYEFEDYRLSNGLRVILLEDHSSAVVAVNVWYNVGSGNEVAGRSGFAHLFEHMMFEGSEHVGKGEHLQLVERAGGSMNGTTNQDRTAYFETLPANRLNLGLWLEADRMRSLRITDDNFENQRETVKEERRLRVDNQPYGKAFTDGLTLPFDSTTCFAYAHTVIGSMDDLNSAETADVQAFFDLYYAPNNATLVLVGDFDPSEARDLIDSYFGSIPRGAEPGAVTCEVDFRAGPRARTYEDEHANLPAVLVLYTIPAHSDAESRPLQALSNILGGGESSRLHRSLVREAKTALQTGAQMDSRRAPGMFIAFAIANQGVDAATLAEQLHAEVGAVLMDGVTEAELEKAKSSIRSGQVFGRQMAFGLASSLQHYAHYHESIDEIRTDLERYMAVTADDIRKVAAKYLIPENSFTITVVPKPDAEEGGGQ